MIEKDILNEPVIQISLTGKEILAIRDALHNHETMGRTEYFTLRNKLVTGLREAGLVVRVHDFVQISDETPDYSGPNPDFKDGWFFPDWDEKWITYEGEWKGWGTL